jgi:GAF domain-containing protein
MGKDRRVAKPGAAPEPSAADLAQENARLQRELTESLRQQTATAEVLKVISRSSFDLMAALNALVETAARLSDANMAFIFQRNDDRLSVAASHGYSREFEEYGKQNPIPIDRGSISGRVVLERKTTQIVDALADPDYSTAKGYQARGGYRTMLGVPLMREGDVIGGFVLTRAVVKPFTAKQIALVETFADQAVIAIENARLFNEVQARTEDLTESLQQQTATADVLKVISRSAFDLPTTLKALLESAARLCDATTAFIFRRDGEVFRVVANYGFSPEFEEFARQNPTPIVHDTMAGRVALERKTIHVADALADPDYATGMSYQAVGGYRTMLGVPLLRQGEVIGEFFLTRSVVKPFTDRQVELVTTFADQAMIAIENVRLFEEVQARTREVTEALEQQTATADMLNVISRSTFNLQPVLDSIAATAARLCQAEFAIIFKLAEDGAYHIAAAHSVNAEFFEYLKRNPVVPGRATLAGRAVLERRTIHILDLLADPEYNWSEAQRRGNSRSALGVPLMREGVPIGVISLLRTAVIPFTDKQAELVTTFADQAVIAIENVRLFEEVQARTEDLAESLQQQTATADVLKLISRSTFDLQTVLRTLVESAARLCEADKGTITRQIGGKFYRAESFGFSQEFMDHVRGVPVEPERGSGAGRALLEGKVVHIADVSADREYTFTEAQKLGEFRTLLGVPMLKEGVPIGVVTLGRSEVRPFTDKQIALVATFADQAAIAMENVRLFESVEARTRELARSLDELRTAQDRLVQTEKLASLGQLTAGIAHEIKNPLNFVNNFASVSGELVDELQQLLEAPALDATRRAEIGELAAMLKDNLAKVVQHGKRADSIVKNMLLHSRMGSGERRPVDVNGLVEEAVNLAYHGARAENRDFNITLERAFDPAAGRAELFPQEITRVLLNLIANGFYAATKRRQQDLDQSYQPTLKAATRDLGNAVEIVIRDNGTGIPPEVKAKIFNPFFTTKPPGEGTGLGWSLSHDIVVKQHGGELAVATEPGQYTEFCIVLPRAAPPPPGAAAEDRA